jgi:hypothetical protein
MTVVADRPPPAPEASAARPRKTRAVQIGGVVVVVVVALVIGGVWWFRGGTFLEGGGAGYGGVVVIGAQMSVGIDLWTRSGPSVVLDRASTATVDGVRVSWSIYRNGPHELGFGSVSGPLSPGWPTTPVHGYRVAQPAGHPERGATWLVESVTASRPGLYRLGDVSISYRSGARIRRTSVSTSFCLLVVRKSQHRRTLRAVDAFDSSGATADGSASLVARYVSCR